MKRSKRETPTLHYDFGRWGYYVNDLKDQIMPGFSEPCGVEACGEYDIVFAASLLYCNAQRNASMLLRRTAEGCMVIEKSRLQQFLHEATPIFSGKVTMRNSIYGEIDHHFGPGYNFFGFDKDSVEYDHKPSNATVIRTKMNSNIGRLYVVSERKAFRRTRLERGIMRDGEEVYESFEQEVEHAECVLNSRHYSILCQGLGLPCHVATLITRYVEDKPEFIFAEPGDIWIDIRLSTPKRTYLLARRCK